MSNFNWFLYIVRLIFSAIVFLNKLTSKYYKFSRKIFVSKLLRIRLILPDICEQQSLLYFVMNFLKKLNVWNGEIRRKLKVVIYIKVWEWAAWCPIVTSFMFLIYLKLVDLIEFRFLFCTELLRDEPGTPRGSWLCLSLHKKSGFPLRISSALFTN